MSLFDAYLMVDWSAAARPVTGNDSIWLCLLRRRGGRLQRVALDNLATRTAARARIEALLGRVVADGGRVLASFDFPNAYP
ncbi:MAG TPA: precorrin-8X methylmutase, partial [Alphaproteobacteria bacterium]|nr:precorrin-8X methylmutase [Alphaproteobacteria bacterium]